MITAENLKKAKGLLKQRGHDVIADVKGLDLTDGDQRRLLDALHHAEKCGRARAGVLAVLVERRAES